jgi:hypothetical protein
LRRRKPHHVGPRAGIAGNLVNCGHVDHRLFPPRCAQVQSGLIDSGYYEWRYQLNQPMQTGARHASPFRPFSAARTPE